MKNLNKKIGAVALAGVMAVGGLVASGISSSAAGLGSGSSGYIDQGGLNRRAVESAIYKYQKSGEGKSEIYYYDYYSNNNNDAAGAKWYDFDLFNDIDDFLDFASKNKMKGFLKVRLEKEQAILVFRSR